MDSIQLRPKVVWFQSSARERALASATLTPLNCNKYGTMTNCSSDAVKSVHFGTDTIFIGFLVRQNHIHRNSRSSHSSFPFSSLQNFVSPYITSSSVGKWSPGIHPLLWNAMRIYEFSVEPLCFLKSSFKWSGNLKTVSGKTCFCRDYKTGFPEF